MPVDQLKEMIADLMKEDRPIPAVVEVLDILPACVSYVDRNEVYRVVNATYEKWFQKPRAQIIGKTVKEIIGAEAYLATKSRIDGALRGEHYDFVGHLPYPSKTRRVRGIMIPDVRPTGAVNGYFGMYMEIVAPADRDGQNLREVKQRLSEF